MWLQRGVREGCAGGAGEEKRRVPHEHRGQNVCFAGVVGLWAEKGERKELPTVSPARPNDFPEGGTVASVLREYLFVTTTFDRPAAGCYGFPDAKRKTTLRRTKPPSDQPRRTGGGRRVVASFRPCGRGHADDAVGGKPSPRHGQRRIPGGRPATRHTADGDAVRDKRPGTDRRC